jgi:hypothetical protein
MTRFQPAYISYQSRIINGLGGILIAALVLTIMLFLSDISKYLVTAIVLFGIFFILNFYSLIRRSKKYLKSIIVTDAEIEITIVQKDTDLPLIKSDIENIRVKVVELFFSFNQFGRNYKLQIDIKQNGRFETVVEQYEVGKWDLKAFKEIYAAYCKAKNVPYSLTSLKRANF